MRWKNYNNVSRSHLEGVSYSITVVCNIFDEKKSGGNFQKLQAIKVWKIFTYISCKGIKKIED